MDLQLSLQQNQTLLPQLIQSMELLRMTAQELDEFLEKAMQENPALEGTLPARYDGDLREAAAPEETETLEAHLGEQLEALSLSRPLHGAASAILAALDRSGYLREPLSALSEATGWPEALLKKALSLVQGLTPAGVGAKDLSECLLLQLERENGSETAKAICRSHLESLARGHYGHIAAALGQSETAVREACNEIRCLSPRPGAMFDDGRQSDYVRPELAVQPFPDGTLRVLPLLPAPELHISESYRALLRACTTPEEKDYLTQMLRQAGWIVSGIAQRQETLLLCVNAIVRRQENFFRSDVRTALRPMTLRDIAEDTGVNASTVSRAVRGKYLACKSGVISISALFSRAVGKKETSADLLRRRIAALLAAENPKQPLSDRQLCEALAAEGLTLARRTAAKYRAALGIPSTSVRREKS